MMQGRAVMVGWKKSWTSAASTYVAELGSDTVWLGRLGSGGAHWNPDYLALGMAANLEPGAQFDAVRWRAAMGPTGAGAALGKGIGDAVLAKFQKEIEETAQRYEAAGRDAIHHKANLERPRAEFASGTLVDKLPGTAPAALKNMDGPILQATLGGKSWFLLGVPGAASIEEFWNATRT